MTLVLQRDPHAGEQVAAHGRLHVRSDRDGRLDLMQDPGEWIAVAHLQFDLGRHREGAATVHDPLDGVALVFGAVIVGAHEDLAAGDGHGVRPGADLRGPFDVGLVLGVPIVRDVLVGQAHQAGRPFAQGAVAPGRGLELLLLIERETLLEATFTIVKGGHGVPKKHRR